MKHVTTSLEPGRRAERGGALAEVVVLVPLALVLVIGIADFGRAAYQSILVQSSAQAGAAYGAQSNSTAGNAQAIETAVLDDLGPSADPEEVTILSETYCQCGPNSQVECDSSNCGGPHGSSRRTYVGVTVLKRFDPFLPYPGLPQSFVLSRTAKVRVK